MRNYTASEIYRDLNKLFTKLSNSIDSISDLHSVDQDMIGDDRLNIEFDYNIEYLVRIYTDNNYIEINTDPKIFRYIKALIGTNYPHYNDFIELVQE